MLEQSWAATCDALGRNVAAIIRQVQPLEWWFGHVMLVTELAHRAHRQSRAFAAAGAWSAIREFSADAGGLPSIVSRMNTKADV